MIKTRQRKSDSGSCAGDRAALRAAEGRPEAGRPEAVLASSSSRSDRGLGRLRCGWGCESGGAENAELCLQGPGPKGKGRREGVRED